MLGVTENCCEWKREGLGAGAVVGATEKLKTVWDDVDGIELEADTVESNAESTTGLCRDGRARALARGR